LLAGDTLLLVHIRLDQARIDRERFAPDQPGRNTHRHHALEHPAQGIALSEALVPRPAEHRMIGNLVLDAELAKPPVGQIDLDLSAQPPLRADRKHVAHNQHPDHQHRIDRGAARMRVVSCKLLVHPTKVKNVVDLAHQMVGWHHLVEFKGIKELALSAFTPTHHEPLPTMPVSIQRNHRSRFGSMRVLQHNRVRSGHCATIVNWSFLTHFIISRAAIAVLHMQARDMLRSNPLGGRCPCLTKAPVWVCSIDPRHAVPGACVISSSRWCNDACAML
jgi:hypothetical protein